MPTSTEVTVEGSDRPWYATKEALETLSSPARVRTTLLSPFDSLLWERPFVERLFGYVHRLEAYVPKPQRVHGYYAMPILAGTELDRSGRSRQSEGHARSSGTSP